MMNTHYYIVVTFEYRRSQGGGGDDTRDMGDEAEAADEVLRKEVLDGEKRKDLSKRLATSFRQIRGYQT